MLQVNSTIPNFSVVDDNGNIFTQNSIKSYLTVLYFYPKDNTPGCTSQALEFSLLHNEFSKLSTDIYGISKDSTESHVKFKEKYQISIKLLSDPLLVMHKSFGAYGEKTYYGKKIQGVIRSTYIINNELKLVYSITHVSPKGHAEFILSKVKNFLENK